MCGIYGQADRFTEEQLNFLDRQLYHRGPDARQLKEYKDIHLFHARLSIIDAEGGAQPMETERYSIVFNGEIYNHLELRNQFRLNGRTRSDTETLLLLYEQHGLGMLPYLDGMFAFAIYDKLSGEVVLCRDRMGEKPLYYLRQAEKFCFGSELNTLKGINDLAVRPASLVQFLVSGWIGPEETVYEHVYHVLPGHYVRVTRQSDGQRKFDSQCWWSYRDLLSTTSKNRKLGELQEELLELLKRSIKRRIESSDLPVGCFLSGGLDSSIVATLASFIKAPLPTYTFIFDEEFNEGPQAALLAERLRTKHQEVHINYDHLQDDIGKIILDYGEPFCDDSAIPSFYIAREAKKLNTVIINGDGGDELFGGYRRYVPLAWPPFIQKFVRGISKAAFPFLPPPQKKINQYNYLYRLAQLSGLDYPDKYLSATTDLFTNESYFSISDRSLVEGSKKWLSDSFRRAANEIPEWGADNTRALSELRQFMLTDIETLLPVVLLKKVDISTMRSSLESRTVFFNPEILSFAAALPDHLLVSGTTTKVMLRKLAKRLLPEDAFKLPKRGFELPLISLINGKLKNIVNDHLMDRNAEIHAIIPRKQIEHLIFRKDPISEDRRSKMLYTLFVLQYWLQYRKTYLQNPG